MTSVCYYIIKKEDLVYDMVKYSMISLGFNENPAREEVVSFRAKMRTIKDTTEGENNQEYIIVKMGFDFSTPFKGLAMCSQAEIISELQKSKWEHNIVV